MNSIRRPMSHILVIFLLLQLLSTIVYAEDKNALLDEDQLQSIVDTYVERMNLNPDMIAVGYVYTATGESWYYNPDSWFYSASLYKVPLMMLLAEQEAKGMIQSDTDIYGVPFSDLEYDVLANSNNHYASLAFDYLGGYTSCREQFRRYSSLPEEYYDPDYLSYSYFSARFMTDVLLTLYQNSDLFPRVIDDLKDAQPGHYFRLTLGDEKYEIAQKYGFYEEWQHNAGIIYSPNPFILTVLTRYEGLYETIISDLALLFLEYTLQLDENLTDVVAEMEKQAMIEPEQTPELTPAQETIQVPEDIPVVRTENEESESPSQSTASQGQMGRRVVICFASAVCVILTAGLFLKKRKEKR